MNFWGFNVGGNFNTFCYTDNEAPLWIYKMQLKAAGVQQLTTEASHGNPGGATGLAFLPENITFDKLQYGIGFEDKPVEIDWPIIANKVYNTLYYDNFSASAMWDTGVEQAYYPPNLHLKQALLMGAFNDCPFWIHQAIFSDFPEKGGTFLGTTLMFRGSIRKVTANRSRIKISLSSLMDVFQTVQIPTQVLTPNSRAVPFVPIASSPWNDGGLFPKYTSVVAISPTQLQASTTYSIPLDDLRDSYVSWNFAGFAGGVPYSSGYSPALFNRFAGNSAGPGTVQFYFYEPYIYPSSAAAWNIYSQLILSAPPQGFPYVPPPEYNL